MEAFGSRTSLLKPRSKRFRSLLGTLALALVVAALLEAVAFHAGSYLATKGVFYVPAAAPDPAAYLAERDPVLGWPSPASLGSGGNRDASGARLDPASAGVGPACVSLYGDSFTWSDEVGDADAWGSVLSQRLGCRVANYGVGGYGTDQAFLRYREADGDRAPVVVLNHSSENVIRNVTRSFDFVYPGGGRGFKPKFVVSGGGGLRLVPLPEFSVQEYRRAVATPSSFAPDDFLAPGGGAGTLTLRAPYVISLVRALGHFRVVAELSGRPPHADFYRPDHPAGGLDVTAEILTAFVGLARDRGQVPVVTVLPNGSDFEAFGRTGEWPYAPLLAALANRGVHALNVGEDMVAQLEGADPCTLFTTCSAHYNAAGYRVVAAAVGTYLEDDADTGPLLKVASSP